MKPSPKFELVQGLKRLLGELGGNAREILLRSKLPSDLFTRETPSLTTDEYFRLWRTLETIFDDPAFPIHLIENLTSDVFSPPIFAAFCSPDLNTALNRLSRFKPLVGPMQLLVAIDRESTRLTIRFLEKPEEAPAALIGMELTFFVQLSRMATRERIVPLSVTSPVTLPAGPEYLKFFGVGVDEGPEISLAFSAEDAGRAFLSENIRMWNFFEPGLRKRLADIATDDNMTERVRGALVELLPAGEANVDAVASHLLVSKRTLQRRLTEEKTSFKNILTLLREQLAHHYITRSALPYSQISYLLGYEDPNSFFRAYHAWTGTTPDSVRSRVLN